MNEEEAAQAIQHILKQLYVEKGETIYLAVDMARIPLPQWKVSLTRNEIRERENRWCSFLFKQISNAVGKDGTILVGTFSYACSNPEIPFIVEHTPSEIGPFTNWLRKQPLALRSIHPIFSVAGVGPNASEILNNNGYSAFGPLSPFGRLSHFNARFVCLGVPISQSITYLHHLEQCYGSNHRYNKIIKTPVIEDGIRKTGPFLAFVRWPISDTVSNFIPFENCLLAENVLYKYSWNTYVNHAVCVDDVDRIGYSMLSKNPYAFISNHFKAEIDENSLIQVQ